MKIKMTEIEANAEELRNSSTLAGGVSDMLRRCFIPLHSPSAYDEEEGDENDEE